MVEESQGLKVRLEEVNLLRTYSAHAEAWARNASLLKSYARKVLFVAEEEDKPSGYTFEDSRVVLEKQLRNLQEAVKDGLALGLDLPVIEELQALCDAFTWSIRASLLLHTQPALEVFFPTLSLLCIREKFLFGSCEELIYCSLPW